MTSDLPRKRPTTGRTATDASSSSRQPSKRVKRSNRTPQTDVKASQLDLHVQASEATQQIAPALQPPLSVEAMQQTTSAPQMALNMQATHLPALVPQPARQMQAYLPPAQPPQPPQQSPQPTTHQVGEGNGIVPIQSVHKMGMHVSDSITQNIIQGRFIELHTLLPPSGGQGATPRHKKLLSYSVGEIISKENVKNVDSIEKWTDAMHIFAYLFAHPSKSAELLKYIHTVRLGVARGSTGWYDYDTQYRLRKALNPTSSWGEVDAELWLLHMSSKLVNHHQSTQSSESGLKCFDYNYKCNCLKSNCQYSHSCIRCAGMHPVSH